jgi:phage terminase small subunit
MGRAKHPHDSSRPERAAVRRAIEADDKEALKTSLTHRQRAFAHEYVVDFNATAAAIRAGYSVLNADKQAYLLTKHKGIIAYIEHLTKSKQAKVMSVNPEYLLQKLSDIMGDETTRAGDKLRAIEMYMKHLGMFIERTEITGKDGEAIRVEQQTKQEADGFLSTIRRIAEKNAQKEETLN